ncbi:MAG TPA: hypothetical protein VFU12_11630 [Glycomyces sp.]|nr:hypothetical protein [Glycomyces sp.]
MSARRDDEARAAGLLRAASTEYDDLPRDVADRLDRVLEQLPTADTLHRTPRPETARPARGWSERLRAHRLRYALLSATAALLITVGAVAAAVQVVSTASDTDAGALSQGSGESYEHTESDQGAAAPEQEDELAAEEEPQASGTEGADGGSEGGGEVETFATDTDYVTNMDVLTALRELGDESPRGTVPPELLALSEGGPLWDTCRKAIAEWYGGLVVVADFARFESEPAVVALLLSESGEIAVAVTPECADGTVEELYTQG